MGKIMASQNIFGLTPKQILDNIWHSNFLPIDILPHCHTADKNTDWLYLIHDGRLLFHKNDCSDEFIDTNYYKQNKQNDDFELYVTKDHFYKAYGPYHLVSNI